MNLNKSLHINSREEGNYQQSLNGTWQYTFCSEKHNNPFRIEYPYTANLPLSAGWCLYKSGLLPHPYIGTNSYKYRFIKDKVWYFRKTFFVDKIKQKDYAYLSFDGCSYYSRIWLNGCLLGKHEGMFGGPVINVADKLRFGTENDIIVECSPCNFGFSEDKFKKDNMLFAQSSSISDTNVMAPWQLTNDFLTSSGDFSVVGIWRSVRLNFLNKYHINNPYCTTESIKDDYAVLNLEIPVSNSFMDENAGVFEDATDWSHFPGYDVTFKRLTDIFTETDLNLGIKVIEPNGKIIYKSKNGIKEYDMTMTGVATKAIDYIYISEKIKIVNPMLWSPLNKSKQPLYRIELELYKDGNLIDEYSLKTGIRTLTVEKSCGPKFHRRWNDFQFILNGEKIFLKGINFTELDQMMKNTEKNYRWILTLAKNAGIQLIRIWSGGNGPEDDTFYDICDELGLMVWQDSLLANNTTRHWNTNYLRGQVSYYLCRIRNHPSFVVHCGGNEFNPYSQYNAASMYAIRSENDTYIPDRIFYPATPDGGDMHNYPDIEPTWFRHNYKFIPFVSECGVHSFPTDKTLQKIISKNEYDAHLCTIFSDDFTKEFPEIRNHFSEFVPDRVPHMLARASHFFNIDGIKIKELSMASQLAAYEYYLIMIEAFAENYPVTTGIMPWVFQRPWPTTAIQFVDGYGNPSLQYYALKKAYEPFHPFVALEHLNYKSGESVKIPVKLFAQYETKENDYCLLDIFSPKNTKIYSKKIRVPNCKAGIISLNAYDFKIPLLDWEDKYFFVRVQYFSNAFLTGESFYTPKVLSVLNDKVEYEKERTWSCENRYFDNGPWLFDQLQAGEKSELKCSLISSFYFGEYTKIVLDILNESDILAYPVTVEAQNINIRCCCSDNGFMLDGKENRQIEVLLDGKYDDINIEVNCFNAKKKINVAVTNQKLNTEIE